MFPTNFLPTTFRVALLGKDPLFLAGLHAAINSLELESEVVAELADYQLLFETMKTVDLNLVLIESSSSEKKGLSLELIRKMKNWHPETQIIILATDMSTKTIFNSLRAGADGYLLKSSSSKDLREAIWVVLHHGSALSPVVRHKLLADLSISEIRSPVASEREKQILELMSRGWANKKIAKELYLSQRTIEAHAHHIYEKLGVGSRTAAVVEAMRRGVIESPDTKIAIPA